MADLSREPLRLRRLLRRVRKGIFSWREMLSAYSGYGDLIWNREPLLAKNKDRWVLLLN